MKILQANSENLTEIITALKNGAVLVLPTDTVYGLACDAVNEKAVEKIFEIKKRDKNKPLAVFVKDIEMAKQYAVISEKQEGIIKKSWPGAITYILSAKDGLAKLVYKENTIGMRQPDYGYIENIFTDFNNPLAQTSANTSGKPATAKISEVVEQFKNNDVIVVDGGDLPEAKPSKVVDISMGSRTILRE